jgi:hypothetical protein
VFCARVEAACRSLLAYPPEPALDVVSSTLVPDGGVIGAALCAHEAGR